LDWRNLLDIGTDMRIWPFETHIPTEAISALDLSCALAKNRGSERNV
jgi:hypothetical protein